MLKFYYPVKTDKIWHRSKSGKKYRLDVIDRVLMLRDLISKKADTHIVKVNERDDSILLLAHSPNLIKTYKSGKPLNLSESSGILYQKFFYDWIVNKAWAHVYAAKHAVENKTLAVVIADGGHHAEKESGFGFNPINGMIIASLYLKGAGAINKVAVLDLDLHYANGTNSEVVNRSWILSVDIWRHRLSKWTFTKNGGNVIHAKVDNAKDYMDHLPRLLKKIEEFKPDLVWYHLGLDVLNDDRLGGIHRFNESTLQKRDQVVSNFLAKLRTPVVITLGGSYINYKKSEEEVRRRRIKLIKLFWNSIQKIYRKYPRR